MTDFPALARTRQSCRKFDPSRPVPQTVLRRVIATGILAPSSCNCQPWHITAISGEKASSFAPCLQNGGMNPYMSDCPAFLVLSTEALSRAARIGSERLGQPYELYDAGILALQLCYAAQAEGLASCIIGWFDEKKIRAFAGLEDSSRVTLVVCVGYAQADDPLREKSRRPVEESATFLS